MSGTKIDQSDEELFLGVKKADLEHVIKWFQMNSMFLHKDEFEYICHRADKSNILSKLPTIWQLFQYETSDWNNSPPYQWFIRKFVMVSTP